MAISFKDYVVISDALVQAELDEGKIWDAIKKKLGGKASDVDIEAEVERLKGLDADDVRKIKQTQQSREFHARKAELAKKGTAKQPIPPMRTVRPGTASNADWDQALGVGDKREIARADRVREDVLAEAKKTIIGRYGMMEIYKKGKLVCVYYAGNMGASEKDSVAPAFNKIMGPGSFSKFKANSDFSIDNHKNTLNDPAYMYQREMPAWKWDELFPKKVKEDLLAEAQDFTVTYVLRDSTTKKKVEIKGRNVVDVKRKFADSHYGARMLSVEPSKIVPKKIEAVEEEQFGPLGPRS